MIASRPAVGVWAASAPTKAMGSEDRGDVVIVVWVMGPGPGTSKPGWERSRLPMPVLEAPGLEVTEGVLPARPSPSTHAYGAWGTRV